MTYLVQTGSFSEELYSRQQHLGILASHSRIPGYRSIPACHTMHSLSFPGNARYDLGLPGDARVLADILPLWEPRVVIDPSSSAQSLYRIVSSGL